MVHESTRLIPRLNPICKHLLESASSIGFQEGLDKIKEMVIAATVAREEAEKVSSSPSKSTSRDGTFLGDAGTGPVIGETAVIITFIRERK